jgi:hypothetical protein
MSYRARGVKGAWPRRDRVRTTMKLTSPKVEDSTRNRRISMLIA